MKKKNTVFGEKGVIYACGYSTGSNASGNTGGSFLFSEKKDYSLLPTGLPPIECTDPNKLMSLSA